MRLLVDTDAFCKLSVGGVLDDALHLLQVKPEECGRLPALPHMLRRGQLRRRLGDQVCERLLPIAMKLPLAPQPSPTWLDKLALIPDIDPGEAQLFAAAAESTLLVLSADKRALRSLKDISDVADGLRGRVVTLEAIFIALCDRHGAENVRARVSDLTNHDTMIKVCFSHGTPDPVSALSSYLQTLETELAPLTLWSARQGRAE